MEQDQRLTDLEQKFRRHSHDNIETDKIAGTNLTGGTSTTVLHGGSTPAYSAVVEADITLADNTTNDASTSQHGFAKKGTGTSTDYYGGDNSFHALPSSKIYNDVSTQSITNTQTLTNLYSFTLTAGTFGTNNAIIGELYIDNCRKGTATLFTLIIKYGTTEVFNIPITFGAAQGGVVRFVIVGNGSTSAQSGWVIWNTRVNATTSTNTNEEHIYYFSAGTAAIDSTANQTLLITGQFTGATTANDTFSSKGLAIFRIS